MLKGILIKSDGSYEVVEYEDSLDELQRIVDGYIEYVMVDNGISMIVNEEGLLRGLDYNEIASRFYRGPCIVGNVLMVGVKNGENISLSDNQIEMLLKKM